MRCSRSRTICACQLLWSRKLPGRSRSPRQPASRRALDRREEGYALANAMPSGAPSSVAVFAGGGATPDAPLIVPTTVLVAGLMTVMSPSRMLPTQTCEPSGVIAMEPGSSPTITLAAVRPVAVLIAITESEFMSVTYAVLPSGVTATAYGSAPAGMSAMTRSLAALITTSWLADGLVTYTVLPFGLTARPCAPLGILTEAMTREVAVSITATPFSVVTYARVPSGLNATWRGGVPTVISPVTASVAALITATWSEPPGPVSPPVRVA